MDKIAMLLAVLVAAVAGYFIYQTVTAYKSDIERCQIGSC